MSLRTEEEGRKADHAEYIRQLIVAVPMTGRDFVDPKRPSVCAGTADVDYGAGIADPGLEV